MFSFKNDALWERHLNIPYRVVKHYEEFQLWGHRKFSTQALNACAPEDITEPSVFIWFEFNLNLMAKVIHRHKLEFRIYALYAVDFLLTNDEHHRTFNKLFGDSTRPSCPVILQVRHLVDLSDDTPQIQKFREDSEANMDDIVSEFMRFGSWLDEYAGKNRMQLLATIGKLIRSDSFGTELSDDPNTLSNKFLLNLSDKLQSI